MRRGTLLLEVSIGIALLGTALTALSVLAVQQLRLHAEHLRRIQAELVLDGELALLRQGEPPENGPFTPRIAPPSALSDMQWHCQLQEESAGVQRIDLVMRDPRGHLPEVRVSGVLHAP